MDEGRKALTQLPMIEVLQHEDGVSGRIILRPNLSASWRTNLIFVLFLMLVMQLIAAMFAYLGAWPILPFAGAESLFILLVLYFWYRRYAEQEVLTFAASHLLLERGQYLPRQTWQFDRFWLRGYIDQRPQGLPSVYLKCQGRALEIGRYLSEDEKRQLVRCLPHFVSLV